MQIFILEKPTTFITLSKHWSLTSYFLELQIYDGDSTAFELETKTELKFFVGRNQNRTNTSF